MSAEVDVLRSEARDFVGGGEEADADAETVESLFLGGNLDWSFRNRGKERRDREDERNRWVVMKGEEARKIKDMVFDRL